MYLFHFYIIVKWESNINFEPINDDWLFSFIFSGLLLFTIVTTTILHVVFEAPFAFVWAEILKLVKKKISSLINSEPEDIKNIKTTNREDTSVMIA